MNQLSYVLLRIVCGVGEDPWVHTPVFTIEAFDHNAVLVSLNEVFV